MEVNVDGTSLVIQSWKLLFDAQFSCGTFALNCVRLWILHREMGGEHNGQAPARPPYCTWVEADLCTEFGPAMMRKSEGLNLARPPKWNIYQDSQGCLKQRLAWEKWTLTGVKNN